MLAAHFSTLLPQSPSTQPTRAPSLPPPPLPTPLPPPGTVTFEPTASAVIYETQLFPPFSSQGRGRQLSPARDACFESCRAFLPQTLQYFNVYPNQTDPSRTVCSCVEDFTGTQPAPPGAEVYAVCLSSAGLLGVETEAARRTGRPGKPFTYRIMVHNLNSKPNWSKLDHSLQALGLTVQLPPAAHVQYLSGHARLELPSDSGKNKMKKTLVAAVVGVNSTLAWGNFSVAPRQTVTFKVRVRVRPNVTAGTVLRFEAAVAQAEGVYGDKPPLCTTPATPSVAVEVYRPWGS